MTQMQTPPPPAGQPPTHHIAPPVLTGPAPWSALAISGFVCALLGFFGVTAILGIILGVAGIIVTKGGRRRGMGLAIAAIPISVITGLVAVLVLLTLLAGTKLVATFAAITPVFDATAADRPEAMAKLRKFTSKSFDNAVSDEQFFAWMDQVVKDNGKLTELTTKFGKTGPQPQTSDYGKERFGFTLPAKFVNGSATILVIFRQEGYWEIKLDDIKVAGVSPRGSP